MKVESISEIWVDDFNKLCIKPESKTFDMIYRSAMGVNWNNDDHYLFSQIIRSLTPADWFHQIITALEKEYGYRLYTTDKTKWKNIDESIRRSIETNDKVMIMVAEPWNFESSDGQNKFYCKIVSHCIYKGEEVVIAKCLSTYNLDGKIVNYIALSNRDNNGHYNIFVVDDIHNFDLSTQNFRIIGSLVQK